METSIIHALGAKFSTYTEERDDLGLSEAVVRREWVAENKDITVIDEVKVGLKALPDKKKQDDPGKEMRDKERHQRLVGMDKTCAQMAWKRLRFSIDSWRDKALLENEEALFVIPCVGFDCMPTSEEKRAGMNAIMLTLLKETVEIEETTKEGRIVVNTIHRTRHRLHFLAREHSAEFEGAEAFQFQSRLDAQEAELSGSYLSQHNAHATYATLTLEDNLFHVHGEELDQARLMFSWAGGHRREKCLGCLDCLEPDCSCSALCCCYDMQHQWMGATSRRDDLQRLVQTLELREKSIIFDMQTIFPRLKTKAVQAQGYTGDYTATFHAIYLAFRDPSTLSVKTCVVYADPQFGFIEIVGLVSKLQSIASRNVKSKELNNSLTSIRPKAPLRGNFSDLLFLLGTKIDMSRKGLTLSGIVGILFSILVRDDWLAALPSIILNFITSVYMGLAASKWFQPLPEVERTYDLYMSILAAIVCFINAVIAMARDSSNEEIENEDETLSVVPYVVLACYSIVQGAVFLLNRFILAKEEEMSGTENSVLNSLV